MKGKQVSAAREHGRSLQQIPQGCRPTARLTILRLDSQAKTSPTSNAHALHTSNCARPPPSDIPVDRFPTKALKYLGSTRTTQIGRFVPLRMSVLLFRGRGR